VNQAQLIESVDNFYARGKAIIDKKNTDYAKGDVDAFSNFKATEIAGVTYQRSILVLLAVKLARLSNLLDKETAPNYESLSDTVLDMANYLAILNATIEDEAAKKRNS
jgi:hypothetical protein